MTFILKIKKRGKAMKKMLLSAAALFLLMFSINSMALELNAGIKGGLSLGNLTGKYAEQFDTAANGSLKAGFAGYGLFGIDVLDNFGAQIELGYVNKGKSWSSKSNSKNTVSFNFDYLEIPILVKGMLPLGPIKPMLYAGPTLGFLLSSAMKMHVEQTGFPTRDTSISIPDSSRNGFDFGLAIGAGSTFAVGPGAIIFDIRYTFGFNSVPKLTQSEINAGEQASDVEMKTGTLAIMVGYQFKI
jgi:opacity protein-like surface antigen